LKKSGICEFCYTTILLNAHNETVNPDSVLYNKKVFNSEKTVVLCRLQIIILYSLVARYWTYTNTKREFGQLYKSTSRVSSVFRIIRTNFVTIYTYIICRMLQETHSAEMHRFRRRLSANNTPHKIRELKSYDIL